MMNEPTTEEWQQIIECQRRIEKRREESDIDYCSLQPPIDQYFHHDWVEVMDYKHPKRQGEK